MGKSSKYKKKNSKKTKLEKEETIGIVSLFMAIILSSVIFVFCYDLFSKYILLECFYYESSLAETFFILCWALNFVFIPISVTYILKKAKKLATITTIIAIVLFLLPYVFVPNGISADETSIKIMSFGNVKKEYFYSEIKSCEMGLYGQGRYDEDIIYNIEFDDGEQIFIYDSSQLTRTNFKKGTATLVKFNKLVAKNCDITLDSNSNELFEKYFDNKADYKYFKRFIKNAKNSTN